MAFSDIPILMNLPHANQFAFTFLDISTSGITGGSILHGSEVDVTVFRNNGKWIFAVSDDGGGKGFKFSRLMPVVEKTPMADFHLNNAALIFAEDKLNGKVSNLPEVAMPFFKEIYGSDDALMSISSGITLAANLSPGQSSGFANKGMSGIGVAEDFLIEGALKNIFGGTGDPSVSILVEMEQGATTSGASHIPKMLNFPSNVGFFINFQSDSFEVGLQNDAILNLPNKKRLDLVSKLELGLNEKGFNVDIFLDLEGKWKEPFDIPGLELDEVGLKFGITMEGEAIFGFTGKSKVAGDEVDLAAEMSFILEAEGLPDGIAIKGKIDQLGFLDLLTLAENMAGIDKALVPADNIPLPAFKNVEFAFANPGINDPDLGLVDSGFLLKGEMDLFEQKMGSAFVSAGPQGIKMDGDVADINLRGIKLKNNRMKINLGYTSPPVFEIDTGFDFLGVQQKTSVIFNSGIYEIKIQQNLAKIWEADVMFGYGFDLSDDGVPDVFLEVFFKDDFDDWVSKTAPEKIKSFFEILNKQYKSAKERILTAENNVTALNRKINQRKEVIQRERSRALNVITNAQRHVKDIRGRRDHDCSEASHEWHRCKHWHPRSCGSAAHYGWLCGRESAEVGVADGVLRAAKTTVDHLPSELMDPELLGLEASRDTAMAVLRTAMDAIDGLEQMDRWMETGLSDLLQHAKDAEAIEMKNLLVEGDMDAIVKGAPLLMSTDLSIFGKDLGNQTFAFKLDDPIFDAAQLAYIPLHMISVLFEKYIPKGLEKLMGPVRQAIVSELQNAERIVHQELQKLPSTEKKDLDQMREDLLKETANNDTGIYPSVDIYAGQLILAKNLMTRNYLDSDVPIHLVQNTQHKDTSSKKLEANSRVSVFKEKLEDYKQKRKSLLEKMLERNKPFYESYIRYVTTEKEKREQTENDMYSPYTDIHVLPGELFNEKLLVARHAKLCLGENAIGKVTFHPCNENTGGLLWATRKKLVDPKSGKVIPYDAKIAVKYPNLIYTQLVHNGSCLTTPFHLATHDNISRIKHAKRVLNIVNKGPKNIDAHLRLMSCRPDGNGQLWKVKKITHSQSREHGFVLQERDTGFCLRPDDVKAHTKKKQQVLGVFYPCSGVAHATFEIKTPNADMPIWYDHNGVIKSDEGFCLNVPVMTKSSERVGSPVYLKECEDQSFNRWDYVVEYDKKVKIVSDYTGFCLYPYQKDEGQILDAKEGQLVQRPCDARYGQGWSMRIIPKSKFFQLEALDNKKKPNGLCMVPEKANTSSNQVKVFIKNCNPQTRGRWEFGHWKGNYQWVRWDRENSGANSGSVNDLSKIYWVSKDDQRNQAKHGVCRVIFGNSFTGQDYEIYPGTWIGKKESCMFKKGKNITIVKPSQIRDPENYVEVLSGLNVGLSNSTGSWRDSASGVPFDESLNNLQPPKPKFSPYLVGGSNINPHFYMCRVKSGLDGNWYYGYQIDGKVCETPARKSRQSEVLVFKNVN